MKIWVIEKGDDEEHDHHAHAAYTDVRDAMAAFARELLELGRVDDIYSDDAVWVARRKLDVVALRRLEVVEEATVKDLAPRAEHRCCSTLHVGTEVRCLNHDVLVEEFRGGTIF